MVIFNQMSHAQSADSRASCAMDAQKTFQDLGREYAAVMDRLNQPYEVVTNDYQSHYSAKARRCLLLVHKTTSLMQELQFDQNCKTLISKAAPDAAHAKICAAIINYG
jgi:hypothetical protein